MTINDRRRARFSSPAFVLTASLVAVFTPAATSNPKQEESERVLKEGRGRNNITEVTKLKLKGARVLFAKKFVGDDDWLKGLSVSVKNVSPEPITYVELEIRLFGDGDKEPTGRPLYIYPLSYGRPAAREVAEAASDAPPPVDPGGTVEIVLTDEEYLSLKNHLVAADYPLKMKQAELLVTDVFFADGTRWYKGMRLRRSPDDPARWVADKDATNQARGAPRPGPTPEPTRARGPLALRAEAAFIFAGFNPAPIPPAQEPCREAKPPIDEIPYGVEFPGFPGDIDYCLCSPVLIDVAGDGFRLTAPAVGVPFDLNGDGVRGRISGRPRARTTRVFASLRLWRDANHDGISEPGELRPLPESNVMRLDLDYKEPKRTDEYGNRFKYRAAVRDAKGARVGRRAWDVYLVRAL